MLKKLVVGLYQANCYILGCKETREGAVIDPGDEGNRILERCGELGLKIQYIVNTHGHVDHILDNGHVKEQTGAPIIVHPKDASMLTNPRHNLSAFFMEPKTSPPADLFFKEGEPFRLGELEFDVLHTPGHSPGSICLVNGEIAIVGDVLFYDSIGRTDFPEGSFEQLISSIKQKLLPRGDHIRVFPGHGPDTTLGRERQENPFLTGAADFGF